MDALDYRRAFHEKLLTHSFINVNMEKMLHKTERKKRMAKTTKKAAKAMNAAASAKKEAAKETVKTVEAVKVEAKPIEKKSEPVKAAVKKEEVKKVEAKAEPKKIAAKKEPEKITAKAEPKKITAAKPLEKIEAKPAPEKIAEKKETVAKEDAKPATKKAAPKKAAAKKAPAKKETKAAAKEEVKAVVKEETKAAKPAAKKAPAKKTAAKKVVDQEKLDHYNALPLDECIRLMQVMNVHYNYDDYYQLLLDEADYSVLEKNIIEGNGIKEMNLKFTETGYDEDLVMVTLTKVGDTMDIKAADYKDMKKQIAAALKFKFNEDGEVNAAQYLDEFKLSEKILMIGQRKNITTATEIGTLLDADVTAYYQHFFTFAYELLPGWQYNDVKFYEDFAYAVLSQFADLFETEQQRIQIDVADLYIKHGDYQHGDELYGYILRDNQIKDYIYYRYASVYKDIDYNKAKSIAYSSLQYVDDRYTYYPNIMEIINN